MSDTKQKELHKGWALALLVTVQFMLILDSSIVNVALPSVQHHFHVHTESTLSWVIDGYVFDSACTYHTRAVGNITTPISDHSALPAAK